MKIKKYILLLICFVVWIGLLFYFSGKEDVRLQKNISQYVLIDQFHFWEYANSKWKSIDSVNDFHEVENNINWKKFDVYINNSYYNTLDYVLMNHEEYYFDDNSKSYEITQDKLLLNHDSYLEVVDFDASDFSSDDISIVEDFMGQYNYSFSDVLVKNKYVIDENNVVYLVSNYSENNIFNVFYLGFYRKNNKNYLLMNINNSENILYYKLYSVLDIKDKYNNLILSYGCQDTVCYDMYEYNDGEFVKVIGD